MADTTYYVSNTATNGYVVGANSGAGATKIAPYLTPEYAIGIAKTVAGSHTIIINDGVYLGTALGAGGYLSLPASPTSTSITVQAAITGNVQFVPSVTTAVIRATDTTGWGGKSLVFTGIVLGRDSIDVGGTDANYLLYLSSALMASNVNITVNNCTFYNPVFYGVTTDGATQFNITINDCEWIANRLTTTRGFAYTTTIIAGTLIIDGLIIDQQVHNTTGHGTILWDAAAAGVNVTIANITGTIGILSTNVGVASATFGIRLANCDNVLVEDCILAFKQTAIGATWSAYGIHVWGNDVAIAAATSTKIRNCECSFSNWTGGFGITIGGDSTGRIINKNDNGKIYSCRVIGDTVSATGGLHGVGIVASDNGEIFGCTSTSCDIGILSKLTTGCKVIGNLTINCGEGSSASSYYNKGGTNDFFYNNTAIIGGNKSSIGFQANATVAVAPDIARDTTGAIVKNNYIAILTTTTNKVISIAASQTATFDYNHYTVIGTLPANPFTYQATNYANTAAWIAARETNGVDLGITNPMTSSSIGDYSPAVGSALVGTSPKNWTGPNPIGANGEPFSDIDTDIGGIQSIHGPFHPVNL